LLSIFLFSCENDKTKIPVIYPEKSEIIGLATPVNLNIDETIINLTDFFPTVSKFENIKADKNLKIEINGTKVTIKILSDKLPKLSVLSVVVDSVEYSILLKKSNKIKHKFSFETSKNYKIVQLKGEFNAWNPQNTILEKKGNTWETELTVEQGKYQYLLVVEGLEQLDPNNSDSVSNNIGGFNSLMKVGNADNSQVPELYTISYKNENIVFGAKNNPEKIIALYDNYLLIESDFNSDYSSPITIKIPKDAEKKERTYLRVYSYNEFGISNQLLIPLDFGKVLSSPEQINRTDFEAAVLYNTFIDRFYDGKPENNRPTNDPDIHPRANYYGGDIVGITKKIEDGYFQQLGVNTIWISPIVKNPEGAYGMYPEPKTKFSAYHGYWPISFTKIDNRFGTEDEFKQLVELAHKNNMNVLLDFVANHVHEDHPIYQQHKDWATQLYLPDGSLNTERWDEYRLTTWFDVFLPTLDLENSEVYEMLTDSAIYWIKKYDLDGFRHDATKHIPQIFWQTLTQKLKQQIIIPQNRKLYQIGETYGTAELISSYVNTGQLNAQFDFNVYDAIITCLATERSFEDFSEVINNSTKYYGNHHLMGNITGNQDRGRFISYASGSLSFSEDAKRAGWTREVGIDNPIGYKKSAMLNAIISTIPGVPVIYYGDEIGLAGGNDPDNRRMMRFENLKKEEQELKDITAKILNLRKNSLPLIFGDFKILEVSDDIIIYQRTYFGEIAIIIINKNDSEKSLKININERFNLEKLQANFDNKFSQTNNKVEMTISGNSFEILSN